MRIVGGQYKGRIFRPGKSFKARPTTDVAKEGLFNILTNTIDFEETKVLDLFAGTGSISYEFASRGCQDITLVELNFTHYKFINEVIEKLGTKCIKPIKGNVFKFTEKTKATYDLIFADPPFDLPKLKDIPDAIFNNELLNENGMFILEHPKSYEFNSHPNFKELRRYGNVHFSFFKA